MTRSIPWLRVLIEGVVIVGSILLALAADAWWDGRQERGDELALLAELRTTLQEDLTEVTENRDTISYVSENLSLAVERLKSGDLLSTDREHQEAMRSMGRFVQVMIRYGPFETLKARGLDLISNESLRVSLTSLYEDQLPALQSNAEIDQRLSRERILPFQLGYFRLDEQNNWLLRQDEAEARALGPTLARYRAQTLVRYFVPSFDRALHAMSETLAEIEAELEG